MKEWEEMLLIKIDEMLNSIVSGERGRHPHSSQLDLMLLYLMMRVKQYDTSVFDGQEEQLKQVLNELKEFQIEQEGSFARILQGGDKK
ncbi:hypothetical protein KDN24_24740 [Bacillus sp. Bva_UNVM-123]|uniref:hypothetical protein n=1 Tax=Bacillus sp. Bva_UNVM-123 TaxID=2829798 RepID=UPI00391EE876